MKILVFPLSYPNEFNKTANIFTKEQVDELARNNEITVAFVQLLPTRMFFKKKNRKIEKHYDGSVCVYSIQMHTFLESKFPGINGRIYKRYANKLLKYVIDQNFPDCIYSHFSIYAGWAATSFGLKNGIPVVVQEHDGKLIANSINSVRKKMLSFVCNNATEVICVSENLKKHIEYFTGIKRDYKVVGNIVPNDYLYYPRIKTNHFVFLCVANLYAGKNVDYLVDSFCKAFSSTDSVQLRICGDGDCKKKIEKQIEEKHRENQVFLLGRLGREAILHEYINSDCFALPSDHETFGIVYREAMAVGRPIISTNHGGFNSGEINTSNGIIVKIGDDSLIDALRYVYENIDQYDEKQISSDCLSRFGKDTIILSIQRILESAITK